MGLYETLRALYQQQLMGLYETLRALYQQQLMGLYKTLRALYDQLMALNKALMALDQISYPWSGRNRGLP
jgi:hypothetical protein